jgi:hypothetical protein
MTILTKERVDDIAYWSKEMENSGQSLDRAEKYRDIATALTELSELRKRIANNYIDYDNGHCMFCGCFQDFGAELRNVHSDDCPVLAYADYKQEE